MYLLVNCKNESSKGFDDPTFIIFAVVSVFVMLTYFMASVEAGCLI